MAISFDTALPLAANLATVLGMPIACVALLFNALQIREQRRLARQQKSVDIFVGCMETYRRLQSERPELRQADPLQSEKVQQHATALWNLYATEFEYAVADFLPLRLYQKWFELLHAELKAEPPAWNVAGVTPLVAWDSNKSLAAITSPAFADLVEKSLQHDVWSAQLERLVRGHLKQGRAQALFPLP